MHMLHLLRHAKSSWRDDVEDHERQLNRRGREAAQLIGRRLPDIGRIDLVLCSSAVRTRETLELILARTMPPPPCLIEDDLYLADWDRLIERLARLDEDILSVLLVGHNPGLHQLAVALAEPHSPMLARLANKFPTLARASFDIGTRWSEIGGCRHRLVDYATPASLSGDAS
ncbi:MAG TPA: histidine phosphatase family protein [Stellaceae bacterium]|nr:histidine phosphatase family protein [Stellaceae bacterium]